MSSWWRRFFGLDDDDWDEDRQEDRERFADRSWSPARGRFADPARNVQVRMKRQYPFSAGQRRNINMDHASQTMKDHRANQRFPDLDEPAYLRFGHPDASERTARRKEYFRPLDERAKAFPERRKTDDNDAKTNVKPREPFRPTAVASPIYGYRPRRMERRPLRAEPSVDTPAREAKPSAPASAYVRRSEEKEEHGLASNLHNGINGGGRAHDQKAEKETAPLFSASFSGEQPPSEPFNPSAPIAPAKKEPRSGARSLETPFPESQAEETAAARADDVQPPAASVPDQRDGYGDGDGKVSGAFAIEDEQGGALSIPTPAAEPSGDVRSVPPGLEGEPSGDEADEVETAEDDAKASDKPLYPEIAANPDGANPSAEIGHPENGNTHPAADQSSPEPDRIIPAAEDVQPTSGRTPSVGAGSSGALSPAAANTDTERAVFQSEPQAQKPAHLEEVRENPDGKETHAQTDRPKRTVIPYNVLMFGSDRLALKKKGESRLPAASAQSKSRYALPLTLLKDPEASVEEDAAWIAQKREALKQALKNFHVAADIVAHVQGPSVTRFEIHLHPGVKVNKVVNLTEDIKLHLAAHQIRIAPVAGKNTVGIEIPNDRRKPVFLKQLLASDAFQKNRAPLSVALGIDISGRHIVTDVTKMPHGLIAGATGSGKSVCIHSFILSLIYKASPEELRLILIDPKVVELAAYRGLPHLAAPVINEPKEAALALRWAVEEMERRYRALAEAGVRDITRYNAQAGDGEKWPYIVIIIDELADLMMASPQDVEESICRIAQKARAAGIHLLLATQRPSVDVITGLIKANIPTRIAFSVSSQADSRTILDTAGAERLLGRGDMLFAENGSGDVIRLQGAFVTDEEIDRITAALADYPAPPHMFDPSELRERQRDDDGDDDELFEEAARFVIEQGQASVSALQRRFRIGYNRAARLIEQLERSEVVSEANGSKPRQILMNMENFERIFAGGANEVR